MISTHKLTATERLQNYRARYGDGMSALRIPADDHLALVLYWKEQRRYWADAYEGAEKPSHEADVSYDEYRFCRDRYERAMRDAIAARVFRHIADIEAARDRHAGMVAA